MNKSIVWIYWDPRVNKRKAREKVEKRVAKTPKQCGECHRLINAGEEYYHDIFWREGYKNHYICEDCWRGEKLSAKAQNTKFVKVPDYLKKRVQKRNSVIL